jgi:type-F conjugative transfer system pilin assembly protein TrbC
MNYRLKGKILVIWFGKKGIAVLIKNTAKLTTILIYFLCFNAGLALDIDYQGLKNIEQMALNKSQVYIKEVEHQVVNINKLVDSNISDNEQFINEQKAKLKQALNQQGKPKNIADILVFVSFSMPKEALKSLLIQSSQYNAAIIIQGLVDNSLPKTLSKMAALMKETNNQGGLQIDPNLFDEYKINSVPAIVLVQSDKENNFDLVYGLANIKDALEIFRFNNKSSAGDMEVMK